MRVARVNELLPAGNGPLDGSQGAAQQNRCGHHDPGRRIPVDHEPGTGAEHGNLHELAQDAARARKRTALLTGGSLGFQRRAVEHLPAADERGSHAQCRDDFGPARGALREAPRFTLARLKCGQRRARRALVDPRQKGEQRSPGGGDGAQHRMKQPDHEQIDREPGRVQQGCDALPGKESAQRGDVPQTVQGCFLAR